jgi:DNA-binding FadR family transcriptional regulator
VAKQAAPVVRRGLHREVVHQLGLRIIRGELAPGETLPEESTLGEQFGVSRTVLREAIKVLAAKGLIESRPRIGTRVRPRHGWNLLDPDVLVWRFEAGPDEAFLREITEVRRIIEPAAAGLAAERATPEEVAAIVALCERLEEAAVADGEEYIDADMAYHMAILEAGHNDLLSQLGDAIAVALRISRRLTITIPGSSLGGMPTHWGVTRAIRDRDPGAADRAMRALISHTAGDLERALHRSENGRAEAVG